MERLLFIDDKVYCSPHRRAIETLLIMLENHPQKSNLDIVLLPLAKEFLGSFGNVPILVSKLKKEYKKRVVKECGFNSIDFSMLKGDNLWYLKQLEVPRE